MSGKKIFGWIFKSPLIILNLATLGVGIYAALGKVPGFLISWWASIILGGLQLLYLIGALLIWSARKNNIQTIETEEQLQFNDEVLSEQYVPEQN